MRNLQISYQITFVNCHWSWFYTFCLQKACWYASSISKHIRKGLITKRSFNYANFNRLTISDDKICFSIASIVCLMHFLLYFSIIYARMQAYCFVLYCDSFDFSPFSLLRHSPLITHTQHTPHPHMCVCVEYDTLPAEILLGSTSHLRVEDGEIQIENIPLKSPGRGSHLLLPWVSLTDQV